MAEATTGGTENERDNAGAAARPTMAGFNWRPRPEPPDPPIGNLWCLRTSVCALLGWPDGSDEWNAFIKAPHQDDLVPLFKHLGLLVCDVGIEAHLRELAGLLDHRGILMFQFARIPIGHAVYLGDLRQLAWHHATGYRQLLAPGHLAVGPELFWVVVETRQPPRT